MLQPTRPRAFEAIKAAVEGKRAGWDGSPVSTARIYAELWPLIMNEDWCSVVAEQFLGRPSCATLGSQQTVQLSRRPGRRRYGLWRSGIGGRSARREKSRTAS